MAAKMKYNPDEEDRLKDLAGIQTEHAQEMQDVIQTGNNIISQYQEEKENKKQEDEAGNLSSKSRQTTQHKKKKQTKVRKERLTVSPKRDSHFSVTCTRELYEKLSEECLKQRKNRSILVSEILGKALGLEEGKY